jgi:hypothetical protein
MRLVDANRRCRLDASRVAALLMLGCHAASRVSRAAFALLLFIVGTVCCR